MVRLAKRTFRQSLNAMGCLAFSLACLAPALYDFVRAFEMSRWPAAPGRVTYSDVRMAPAGARSRYFTDIQITYTVNGTQLSTRSVRADSDMSSYDRAWADRIVNRYPKGTAVEVRYKPANPMEARIEIWPQPAIWVLLSWGASALFAAIWTWTQATPDGGPNGKAA
jgi:hypothetical protein